MEWLKTRKLSNFALGFGMRLNYLDFLKPKRCEIDPLRTPTFVSQVEEDVRNNFRVLSETTIGRLGREKRKERPYVTQPSKTYRTELNLAKLNLKRSE